ncbi:MAG TPA: AI-2E family transporter [Saliniramus sp.]|nr:AI-2E family transporter [Saliniramus sp.]
MLQRPAMVLLGIALAFFVWYVGEVLLVIFAGILLAVALSSASDGLAARTPLNRGFSLLFVIILAAAGLVGLGFLVVPQAMGELWALWERMIAIAGDVQQWAQQFAVLDLPEENGENGGIGEAMLGTVQEAAGAAAGVLMTTLGALSTILIIVILGGFVAADPGQYLRGLGRLVPQRHRPRVSEVLAKTGHGLRWWLLGQLVSMAMLGVSTGIGLYLFGIDLWLGLALLTARLTFIPFLGPILAGVPIVAVAFAEGLDTGLFVLAFYLVLQNVEGNIITPMIQERAVLMPPALLIGMQVLFGALFGLPGLILAAPLTVVGMIAVNMLYIEDVLGDEEVLP